MTEDQIREAKARKLQEMGFPLPIPSNQVLEASQASAASSVTNQSMLEKLNMIKNGYKKKDFQKIIQKVDSGAIKHPSSFEEMPVSKPGQPAVYKKPVLETFDAPRTSGYNELLEAERMLNGNGGGSGYYEEPVRHTAPQAQQNQYVEPGYDDNIYGPPAMDYRAKLQDKYNVSLPTRKHENPEVQQRQDASVINNSVFMKKLTELENRMQDMVIDVSERIALKLINEMASEIATTTAKKTAIETTKKIIVEFAKNGKHLLVESAKVKRAEVMSADRVRIDGKIYKLTEVKA